MLNGKEGRLLRRNNDKDTRMKINILLCDDDKDFLQRISDAVAGQPVPPGASICITKSSNPAEITDRQLSQYHIMFLDIDMDERSGMDIARRVRELHLDTVIVFVTNYPEFSMEGYEVRAFRYLLKQELSKSWPTISGMHWQNCRVMIKFCAFQLAQSHLTFPTKIFSTWKVIKELYICTQ